jgi:hypothetical protein
MLVRVLLARLTGQKLRHISEIIYNSYTCVSVCFSSACCKTSLFKLEFPRYELFYEFISLQFNIITDFIVIQIFNNILKLNVCMFCTIFYFYWHI